MNSDQTLTAVPFRLYRTTFELLSPLVFIDPDVPTGEISGSSLAGLFFDTLRTLESTDILSNPGRKSLFRILTGKDFPCDAIKDDMPYPIYASPISFRTTFIKEGVEEKTNRVKINPSMKTAEDGELVTARVLLADSNGDNLRFQVMFTIDGVLRGDSYPEGWFDILDGWIRKVLGAWKGQFASFGPWNTSGYGWARLVQAETWTPSDIAQWERKENAGLMAILKDTKDWLPIFGDIAETRILLEYDIRLSLPNTDAWGAETLHIGSIKEADKVAIDDENCSRFLRFGNCCTIPGTSLRGAFGAFIAMLPEVSEPGKPASSPRKLWTELVGWDDMTAKMPGERRGAIWFPCLRTLEKPKVVFRHSEDQFVRGVYEGGLFSEERLEPGTVFYGTIFVETDFKATFEKLLDFLHDGFEFRLISLGADACHPEISIEEKEHAVAE